jgi:hypothetical protein
VDNGTLCEYNSLAYTSDHESSKLLAPLISTSQGLLFSLDRCTLPRRMHCQQPSVSALPCIGSHLPRCRSRGSELVLRVMVDAMLEHTRQSCKCASNCRITILTMPKQYGSIRWSKSDHCPTNCVKETSHGSMSDHNAIDIPRQDVAFFLLLDHSVLVVHFPDGNDHLAIARCYGRWFL